MTVESVIATVAARLDADIANAVREFETAVIDSGLEIDVIVEAAAYYQEQLRIWRLQALDELRRWLGA